MVNSPRRTSVRARAARGVRPGSQVRRRSHRPRLETLETIRLLSSGALDLDFGQGGRAVVDFQGPTDNAAFDVVVEPDGKTVLTGLGYRGGDADFMLVRYNLDGSLDAGFGQGGIVSADFGGYETSEAVARDAQGRFLVGGQIEGRAAVVRFDASGRIDAGFGQGGRIALDTPAGNLKDLVVDAQGRFLVLADAYINGSSDLLVARFDADGDADPSFGQGGWLPIRHEGQDSPKALALDGQGRVVVLGQLYAADYTHSSFVVDRLGSDGQLDTGFGQAGTTAFDFNGQSYPGGLAIDAQDRIVVVGNATSGGFGNTRPAVARLSASGALDPSFGGGKFQFDIQPGVSSFSAIADVAIAADGGLLVGGEVNIVGYDYAVVRIASDGALDASFGDGGQGTLGIDFYDQAAAVALDTTSDRPGLVVVGRSFNSNHAMQNFSVARFDLSGQADAAFGGDGGVATEIYASQADRAQSVLVDAQSRILLLGTSGSDASLARLTSDGQLDPTFGSGGRVLTNFGSYDQIRDGVIDAGGRIVVIGSVSSDFLLARYDADGDLDSTFGQAGRASRAGLPSVYGMQVELDSQGRIVAAGYTTNNDFFVARFLDTGILDPSFGSSGYKVVDLGAREQLTELRLDATERIVLVGTTESGAADIAVVRLSPDGQQLDTTFNGTGFRVLDLGDYDRPNGAAIDAAGGLVLAGSTAGARGFFLRLTDAGASDSAFGTDGVFLDPQSFSQYNDVAIDSQGRLLVSGYPFALRRFDATGQPDTDFGQGGRMITPFDTPATAWALALQGDGRIVAAGWSNWRGDATGENLTVVRRFADEAGVPLRAWAGGPYRVDEGYAFYLEGDQSTAPPDAGTVTYEWDLDYAGPSFDVDATGVQPLIPGFPDDGATRTVALRLRDAQGNLSPVSTTTLTVRNRNPWGWLSYDASGLTEGGTLTLTFEGVSDAPGDLATLEYGFDFGQGYGAYGASNTATAAIPDSGTITVRARVRDKDGGVGEAIATIVVANRAPTATFGAPATVAEEGTITLVLSGPVDAAADLAGLQYAFDLGQGYGAYSASPIATATAPGIPGPVLVRAKVRDKDGGETEYESWVEVVNQAPTATFVAPALADAGRPFTLVLSSPSDASGDLAGLTYAFDFGNGYGAFGAAASAVSAPVTGYGTRAVRAKVRDAEGAETEYVAQFQVVLPVPGETRPDPGFAHGGLAQLDFVGSHRDELRDLIVQPGTGKTVALGTTFENGWPRAVLARYLADGQLDPSFGDGGRILSGLTIEPGRTPHLVQLDDGRLLLVGSTSSALVLLRMDADGHPDPTFGNDDTPGQKYVWPATQDGYAYVREAALDSQGRIVVGGQYYNWSNGYYHYAARYLADGTLDTSYGDAGRVLVRPSDSNPWGGADSLLALDAGGGALLVGSRYNPAASRYELVLIRLDAGGALDPNFGTGGLLVDDIGSFTPRGATIAGDGAILVAGERIGAVSLVRYLPHGERDAGFGIGQNRGYDVRPGVIDGDNGAARQVLIGPGGMLYVAGEVSRDNPHGPDFYTYQIAVQRFTAAGILDHSFGEGNGATAFPIGPLDAHGVALAFDTAGRIVLGGTSRTPADTGTDLAVMRVDAATGARDATFGTAGVVTTDFSGPAYDQARRVVLDAQGRAVVLGSTDAGGDENLALARFNPDGALDLTFGQDGRVVVKRPEYQQAQDLFLDADGRIYVGGFASGQGQFVQRFTPDGVVDVTFGNGGRLDIADYYFSGGRSSLAVDAAGRLVVVGQEWINGSYAVRVARFAPDGTPDSGFDGDGAATIALAGGYLQSVRVLIDAAGRIVVGAHVQGTGTTVLRLLEHGTPDSSFDADGQALLPIGNGYFDLTALDGQDGVVLLGYDYSGRGSIAARLDASGQPLAGFGEDGVAVLPLHNWTDARVDAEGRLVAVGYNYYFTRLDVSGQVDPTFAPAQFPEPDRYQPPLPLGSGSGWALALRPDGSLIAVGDVGSGYGGGYDFGLVQLRVNAATMSAGGPYTIGAGEALTLDGTVSSDPSGLGLTYAWDLDGDGLYDDATGSAPTLSWAELQAAGVPGSGVVTIGLEVRNARGETARETANLTVLSQVATAIVDVSGAGTYGETFTVTARLTSQGLGVAGQTMQFELDGGVILGTATTDASGLASLSGLDLAGRGAGVHDGRIVARFAGNGSLAASQGAGALTVGKATTTLSVSGLSFVYDASPHAAMVTTGATGTVGVVVEYRLNGLVVAAPTSAGSYTVYASLDHPNYEAAPVVATLEIARATPTLVVNGVSTTYDGTAHAATGTVLGVGGVVLGTPTFRYDGVTSAPASAGTYQVVAAFAGDANYEPAADTSATVAIARRALSIQVDNLTKVYGQAVPAPSGTVVGLIPGDGITVSYSTAATAASAVGSYAITAQLGDPIGRLGNYEVTNTPGLLQVLRAATGTSLVVTPSTTVEGQPVVLSATVAVVAPGAGAPSGTVTFRDGTTVIGTGAVDGAGVATVSTATLGIGTHTVTASYDGDPSFASSVSAGAALSVDPITTENLQSSLEAQVASGSTTVTIQAGVQATVDAALAAVQNVTAPDPEQPVTIVLDLGGQDFHGVEAGTQPGVTLLIVNGNLTGNSPALTVVGGTVIVASSTLSNATNAPTILVRSGRLVVRNSVVRESTNFTQAAIRIEGGTVDLGTAAEPGGNTIEVIGAGELVRNLSTAVIAALGNIYQADGQVLSDGFALEDRIHHALDAAGAGRVRTSLSGDVYVTPASGSLQRGVDAVEPGATIHVAPGSYASYDAGAKLLTVAHVGGPTLTQRADPLAPGDRMVEVLGTAGNDTIRFTPGATSDRVAAAVNNLPRGTFAASGRLVARGRDGDDDIQVAGGIRRSAWLFGDGGNDRLKGDQGPSVLLGGDGDDELLGGAGQDLMVGGQGADQLVGSGGDDLLIGGTTLYDAVDDALAAILAEWTSARSYSERVANLSNPNAAVRLIAVGPAATVFDDDVADHLVGSAGIDWYLLNLDGDGDPLKRDRASDRKATETATDV